MKRTIFPLLAGLVLATAATAAPADDVTAPIHQFIDGFNTGNVKSAYAAYATGAVTIVDEFPPHRWVGPNAPRAWAADYARHTRARGMTDGKVDYGKPTRKEIAGKLAYVIIPTVYRYKERGKPLVEEGEMTFVLNSAAAGWKISSWTWSGVVPHPAK